MIGTKFYNTHTDILSMSNLGFVFTELMVDTSLNDKLIPPHARGQTASARASSTTVNGAQAV